MTTHFGVTVCCLVFCDTSHSSLGNQMNIHIISLTLFIVHLRKPYRPEPLGRTRLCVRGRIEKKTKPNEQNQNNPPIPNKQTHNKTIPKTQQQ